MTHDYWIWTADLSRRAYARDMEIPLIDITVESGIQAFAPTPENLNLYCQNRMTNEEYALAYYEKILKSFTEDQKQWEALEANKDMAFACYCRAGVFCHRHLFAPLYINYLQSKGYSVLFQGELEPHPSHVHIYQQS